MTPGITPRGLSHKDAARYVGLSPASFLALVRRGVLPKPITFGIKRKIWDRLALDASFDREIPKADWTDGFE